MGSGVSFPHELLGPDQIDLDGGYPYDVPGTWNGEEFGSATMEGSGYGTFALRVKLPDSVPERLAVRSRDQATAFRLFVNGTEAVTSGVASDDPAVGEGSGAGGRYAFRAPESGKLELVLQVSNYHHRQGGDLVQSRACRDGGDGVACSR